MSNEQENEVFELIGRLIHTWGSPEIAIDERHTPKLYARFLTSLLIRHRRDGGGPASSSGRFDHPQQPPPSESRFSSGPGVDYRAHTHHAQMATHTSTFSVAQPQSRTMLQQQQQLIPLGTGVGGYAQIPFKPKAEPVYRPETGSVLGTGTIDFTVTASNSPATEAGTLLDFGTEALSPTTPDEEMLATMQTLKNPLFWQNMMMPGYVFLSCMPMPPGARR
jgi:hypothetical protein